MNNTITYEQRVILLHRGVGRHTTDIAASLELTLGQYLDRPGQLLAALGTFDTTHALAVPIVRRLLTADDLRGAGTN